MAVSTLQKTDVESGSNSNGSYVKYPDGTLICYKQVQISGAAVNKAWGGVYESPDTYSFGSWPYAFTESPIMTLYPTLGHTVFVEKLTPTTTSVGSTWLWSPTSRSSATTTFSIMAIGRWK